AGTTWNSRHTGRAPDSLTATMRVPSVFVSVVFSATSYQPFSSCDAALLSFFCAQLPSFFASRTSACEIVSDSSGVTPSSSSTNGPSLMLTAVDCFSMTAILYPQSAVVHHFRCYCGTNRLLILDIELRLGAGGVLQGGKAEPA